MVCRAWALEQRRRSQWVCREEKGRQRCEQWQEEVGKGASLDGSMMFIVLDPQGQGIAFWICTYVNVAIEGYRCHHQLIITAFEYLHELHCENHLGRFAISRTKLGWRGSKKNLITFLQCSHLCYLYVLHTSHFVSYTWQTFSPVWRVDMVNMVCWSSVAGARQAGLSFALTADFHAQISLGFRQNGLEKSNYLAVLWVELLCWYWR